MTFLSLAYCFVSRESDFWGQEMAWGPKALAVLADRLGSVLGTFMALVPGVLMPSFGLHGH